MNNWKMWAVVGVLIVIAGGWYAWKVSQGAPAPDALIGGERSAEGCLGPAGYSFDQTVGACARNFELTPDIRRAAQIAVASVGWSYALAVVSFNSYEEPGDYDITLERGLERAHETVIIRDWQIQLKM